MISFIHTVHVNHARAWQRGEQMGQRILELIDDANLRSRMGQAGRLRVEQHFDLDKQLAAYEQLYLRLCDEHRS